MNDYVVITPLRNEEEHLDELYESMVAQTVQPSRWILVDDGSTDRSGTMVDGYADAHDWIVVTHREDRGARAPGGGIVEAFMSGYELAPKSWDFIVKFDADLAFEPDYFERCLAHFEDDASLGIGGGEIIDRLTEGTTQKKKYPAFHVRGATKIYRRACWDQIGGLVVAKGWDTIDEVKANQLGWQTRSFPDVILTQQRETGRRAGPWADWRKNGQAAWFCGYHPAFSLARSVRMALQRPYLIQGVAFAWGYIRAMATRAPQVDDPALRRYVRRQQRNRLLRRETIWR